MPDQHNLLQRTVHTAYYSEILLDVSYAHFLVRGLHHICGASLICRFSTVSCFYSASNSIQKHLMRTVDLGSGGLECDELQNSPCWVPAN